MGLKRSDRVIIRLERAGGELSDASAILAEGGAETIKLNELVHDINVKVSDLAIVRVQHGETPDAVAHEYAARWRDEA